MRRDDLRRMPLCGGDESLSHDGHWECINNWSDAMGATDPVSDAELFELWQRLAAEDAEWRAKALDAIGIESVLSWLSERIADTPSLLLDELSVETIKQYVKHTHGAWAWLGTEYHAANDPQTMLNIIGRAAALQHWLTEPCDGCDQTGIDTVTPYRKFDGDCGDCDGRGWVPKEGMTLFTYDPRHSILAVPLDWLGDNNATQT